MKYRKGRTLRFLPLLLDIRSTRSRSNLIFSPVPESAAIDRNVERHYDAQNRNLRVDKTYGGQPSEKRIVYDGWREIVIEDTDPGRPSYDVLHGNGLDEKTALLDQDSGDLYLLGDTSIGTIALATDTAGALVEYYRYDQHGFPHYYAYSNEEQSASTINNPFLLHGRRWDTDQNLYYYRNRFYSPELGRFIHRDPSGMVDGPNLYAAFGNALMNFMDLMGLRPDTNKEVELKAVFRSLHVHANNLLEQIQERMGILDSVLGTKFIMKQKHEEAIRATDNAYDELLQLKQSVDIELRDIRNSLGPDVSEEAAEAFGIWYINNKELLAKEATRENHRKAFENLGASQAFYLYYGFGKALGFAAIAEWWGGYTLSGDENSGPDARLRALYGSVTTGLAILPLAKPIAGGIRGVVNSARGTLGNAAMDDVAISTQPKTYSVAFEMELEAVDLGKRRSVHFNRANAALDDALKADTQFASLMDEMIPGIEDFVAKPGGRKTPTGWIWHHTVKGQASGRIGIMR